MDARAMIARRGGAVIQQVAGHRLQPLHDQYPNTAVSYDNGMAYLVLHQTRIVTVDSEGNVRLFTNAHRTALTKRRMNEALEALGVPGRVYQEAFAWYHGEFRFVEGAIVALGEEWYG